MANKWLATGSYVLSGLFFAVTPYFLVDTLTSPSSLVQYAGGGLLLVLALATAVELDVLTTGSRSRLVAAVGVICGFAGLVGQFVLL
jgi:hypothetical protein